ncbi:MAG: hypothetical protein VKJ44_05560 [Synechococcus sp.]|nr:hypothetical protein [Synechococcus sp.]
MFRAPTAPACVRAGGGLLLALLLVFSLPVAACEQHLNGHHTGSDSAREANRR